MHYHIFRWIILHIIWSEMRAHLIAIKWSLIRHSILILYLDWQCIMSCSKGSFGSLLGARWDIFRSDSHDSGAVLRYSLLNLSHSALPHSQRYHIVHYLMRSGNSFFAKWFWVRNLTHIFEPAWQYITTFLGGSFCTLFGRKWEFIWSLSNDPWS